MIIAVPDANQAPSSAADIHAAPMFEIAYATDPMITQLIQEHVKRRT